MKTTLIVFAQYAGLTEDKRLTIAGTFTGQTFALPPDAAPGVPIKIGLPPFYLVCTAECSIGKGTVHEVELRIRDGDGKAVADPTSLGTWQFIVNKHGRPMTYHNVTLAQGLAVPGAGDYVFEFWSGGKRFGEITLYVDVAPLPQS